MATKYQSIIDLYQHTSSVVVKNPQTWQNFLASACKNYKCRFDEQLLIFAQRPDATAVLELDKWNKKFGRWVNRHSKGIAVFDSKGRRNTLKYYFDISDTHNGRYNTRPVPIWTMNNRYEETVIERLVDRFGDVESDSLASILIETAKNAVEDNLQDYLSQLKECKEDSFLEEFDDYNLEIIYKRLATNSVAYMLISRCGLDTDAYFEADDFVNISDFNTPMTANAIGVVSSDIAEMALREISFAIKTVQREEHAYNRTFVQRMFNSYDNDKNQPERSNENEQNHLQASRGLSYPQPSITDRARNSSWQVRFDAQGLSGAEQESDVSKSADIGQVEQLSMRDRANGSDAVRSNDGAISQETKRNRGNESQRPNAVGGTDEQHQEPSGGNDTNQSDLPISIATYEEVTVNLPSVDEQIEMIVEAEENTSSAFSISKEDIDDVLTGGSGVHEGKYRIWQQYQKNEDSKTNINFLKKEYGIGGGTYIFSDGEHGGTWHDSKGIAIDRSGIAIAKPQLLLKWPEVEKRLRALIKDDRYLNQKEKDYYPTYLEELEKRRQKSKRQEFVDNARELSPTEKRDTLSLRLSDFIRDLDDYEKRHLENVSLTNLADVTPSQMEEQLKEPETVQRLIDFLKLVSGRTSDIHSRNNASDFQEELKEIFPLGYAYHVDDKVYIGADEYEIIDINNEFVSLRNVEFPLFNNQYTIEDFEQKLRENPANDHIKSVVKIKGSNTKAKELPTEIEISSEVISTSPEVTTPLVIQTLHNYHIENDDLGIGGAKEKFKNNLAAIHLVHDLEIENRNATPEEQAILSKYVGWGGLSEAFDERNMAWKNEYKELKDALSDEEYRAAMESTLTAFYTPPIVIRAMYDVLYNMGFEQGNILEPACGTGNFLGLLPDSMAGAKFHGVEIDTLSGKIAKQLYQKAKIAIQGFEETNLPDNHFDVVLGNVPFGDFKLNDDRYNKHKFLIHDYFFAKALDKVHAGGVILFITSKGTMDKSNGLVRRYIAQRAELLGAIRLPNNTFRANAGTEVTSDILILQKRDHVIDVEPEWVHLNKDDNGITMNSYFVSHPEMILGDMVMESTRFGMDSTCKAKADVTLESLLSDAVTNITGEIREYDIDEISDEQDMDIPADPDVKNFSYTLIDGKIYFRENATMTPATVSVTAENRIKGLVEIRDCVRRLITYQTDDYPDEMIRSEQETLNRLYDAYSAKYGLINSRGNYLAFATDESYFLLCSLEVLDDEGNFERKADMFSKRTIKPHKSVMSVETASEALAVSIGEKACVDLEFMEQLTGKSREDIINDLHGVIFKIPNSDPSQYVTADEYLSGDVRIKLIIATEAAKTDPDIAINAEALSRVIPKDLTAGEISVRLGATWIPADDIQDFMIELLDPSSYAENRLKVRYTAINGDWFIENKSSDYGNVKATSTYGTKRASAYRIIEDSLNLRDVRIFDYVRDENGNKKAIFNHKETTAAQAKQEVVKQAFVDWIWKDPDRRNRLIRFYNDTFNSVRPREYDGQHITFDGISPEIKLRKHQVDAIAHILYGGNTLLAHKVGAGKTFTMVAAAQESKRLGLCSKSMFVVPNHLVTQWASEYLRLYPTANILVTKKQDFEKGNRKKFCGRISTGDYDAVIIGHSQFERIPMSLERQYDLLQQQLDDIERGIDDIKASNGEQFTVKQLMKTRKAIKTKLDKLNDTKRKDNVIDFEELGIDRLFIDESHFYKNLYLYTKMRNVGGIAQTEAQKSSDLFMKCRYLDELTGNRGTIFATGTPISNSMVELYSVQRYLQYDVLMRNNLQHFDAWASTFGETVTALELAPEGTSYRAKTRFAKFYNLPELMQMFREVADIQTADMLNLPVPKVVYRNVKMKPSQIQTEMVASLAKRAEDVRARKVEPYEDNMLKITNDGRKLALDQRLIDDMLPDHEESKVNACVSDTYDIWQEYSETKAAQLIFCDLSTPKNDDSFNVYSDMREKLIQRGVPAEQIRFIHEANTDVKKKELFAKVRSGEVRVLLGSTPKMGAGTNVQDRLIAIHNLDCPWRPSDLEQRQGRIERQGNQFPEVKVYRYVTEQTFDAYLYQLVESKQKFISQIMTSKSPVRSAEDVDEVALSLAEVKMLATGDVRFKEKMDLDMQVAKLRVLKQSYLSEHYELEDKIIKYYPKEIKAYEERITGYESDTLLANGHISSGEDKFYPMIINGVTYSEKADAGKILLANCKDNTSSMQTTIGSYRGFRMDVYYDVVNAEYRLILCGKMKHYVSLGSDTFGNLTRIENELAKLPMKLEAAKTKRTETIAQLENAKIEVEKPFSFEDELTEKSERLNELNIELNLDQKESVDYDPEPNIDDAQTKVSDTRER